MGTMVFRLDSFRRILFPLGRVGLRSGRRRGAAFRRGSGFIRWFAFFAFRRRRPFAAVIGHIPAAALQVEAAVGNHLLQLPPAGWALGQRGIRKFLHGLRHFPAFLTLVLVNGHFSISFFIIGRVGNSPLHFLFHSGNGGPHRNQESVADQSFLWA
jgi:hypothetical protein